MYLQKQTVLLKTDLQMYQLYKLRQYCFAAEKWL